MNQKDVGEVRGALGLDARPAVASKEFPGVDPEWFGVLSAEVLEALTKRAQSGEHDPISGRAICALLDPSFRAMPHHVLSATVELERRGNIVVERRWTKGGAFAPNRYRVPGVTPDDLEPLPGEVRPVKELVERTPEETGRLDATRDEVLKALTTQAELGDQSPISQAEILCLVDPSLEATSSAVGIGLSILERDGVIEALRRFSLNGKRLSSQYLVKGVNPCALEPWPFSEDEREALSSGPPERYQERLRLIRDGLVWVFRDRRDRGLKGRVTQQELCASLSPELNATVRLVGKVLKRMAEDGILEVKRGHRRKGRHYTLRLGWELGE